MPKPIFSLAYYGPIHFYKEVVKYNSITFERFENFQKQTYRNRQYIYGANGKLMLNIPIKHSKSRARKKYAECLIDNSFKWQELHFKSIETAYRTSPYFEFYEDEILPLYQTKFEKIFDFNMACFNIVSELLNLELKHDFTAQYQISYDDPYLDLRKLINAKAEPAIKFKPYHQVFEEKYGFLPNLSILDLLFNLGPESHNYLKD